MRRQGQLAVFIAIWTGSLALGLTRGGFVPWFLTGCLGLLLAYAWIYPRVSLRKVSVVTKLSTEQALSGDGISVEIGIRLPGPLPVSWLAVRDTWKDHTGQDAYRGSRLLYPFGRKTAFYRYRIRDAARGIYASHRVEVTAGDLFGLTSLTKTLECPAVLTVRPRPLPFADRALPIGRGGEIASACGPVRGGQLAATARPYAPGDPLRRIDWKATARTGGLMVRETDEEITEKLMLFVDTAQQAEDDAERSMRDRLAQEEPAWLDAVAEAAAGLLEKAAAAGTRVGMAFSGPGRQTVFAPASRTSLPAMTAALAGMEASGAPHAFSALLRREAFPLPPGTAIVCVTAAPDERLAACCAELTRSRRRVEVVHVQMEEQAGESRPGAGAQQSVWLERFAAAGCGYSVAEARRFGREAEADEAGA